MSYTETHVGKVKEYEFPAEADTIEKKILHLREKGIDVEDDDGDIYIDSGEGMVYAGEKFYTIKDNKSSDEDISIATKNEDGSISYVLQFYNGGCGFEEALGDALKTL